MGAIFIDGLKLNLYLSLARKESETGLNETDRQVKEFLVKDPFVMEVLGRKGDDFYRKDMGPGEVCLHDPEMLFQKEKKDVR